MSTENFANLYQGEERPFAASHPCRRACLPVSSTNAAVQYARGCTATHAALVHSPLVSDNNRFAGRIQCVRRRILKGALLLAATSEYAMMGLT